jgi:hypothetical protein
MNNSTRPAPFIVNQKKEGKPFKIRVARGKPHGEVTDENEILSIVSRRAAFSAVHRLLPPHHHKAWRWHKR